MSSRQTIAAFAFLVAIIGGGVWLYPTRVQTTPKPRPSAEEIKARYAEIRKRIAASMPPGWQALSDCSDFYSFDDDKTLSFSKKSVKRGKVEGLWSFDETAKRYTISVGQLVQSYTLLHHDG